MPNLIADTNRQHLAFIAHDGDITADLPAPVLDVGRVLDDAQWLKVTVDPRSREVFSDQPQIVPGNRTAVPAP